MIHLGARFFDAMRGIAGSLAAADLQTELEYLRAFLSACCQR